MAGSGNSSNFPGFNGNPWIVLGGSSSLLMNGPNGNTSVHFGEGSGGATPFTGNSGINHRSVVGQNGGDPSSSTVYTGFYGDFRLFVHLNHGDAMWPPLQLLHNGAMGWAAQLVQNGAMVWAPQPVHTGEAQNAHGPTVFGNHQMASATFVQGDGGGVGPSLSSPHQRDHFKRGAPEYAIQEGGVTIGSSDQRNVRQRLSDENQQYLGSTAQWASVLPPPSDAAAVRSNGTQSQRIRLLGRDIFVNEPSHQAAATSAFPHQAANSLEPANPPPAPPHWAATISEHASQPPAHQVAASIASAYQPAASMAPADWPPPYLPAVQAEASPAPAYRFPPVNPEENNFTPVSWEDFYFDDDDEEEEEEEEENEDDEHNHENMRLDVDNMSYEELLALEDHIGTVSTGLSEEVIKAKLKPKKYSCFTIGLPEEEESCCICQEEFVEGEQIGVLNCRHKYHFACIKQWLVQKNSCPVCKKTAFA